MDKKRVLIKRVDTMSPKEIRTMREQALSLTKEKILAMEPGRELSGLVKVEVMGRKCAHVNLAPLNPHSIQHANGAKSRCLACGYKDYNSSFRRDFLYCSTNIWDAWKVVEKIRESDQYNFGRLNKPKDNQVATATDFREQYDATFISFCSELMEVLGIEVKEFSYAAVLTIMRKLSPEAICKAALLAKKGAHARD